jgi:cob(I)alamin adenosyltransferase
LHLARAICRNVEREAFLLKEKLRKEILSYLNRLSDVLFVFARVSNKRLNFKEEIWKL